MCKNPWNRHLILNVLGAVVVESAATERLLFCCCFSYRVLLRGNDTSPFIRIAFGATGWVSQHQFTFLLLDVTFVSCFVTASGQQH